MNQRLHLIMLISSIVIAIIGIVILFNSLELGRGVMSEMMAQNGGSMNMDTYHIYLQAAISNYRIAGTIVTALGGAGCLLCLNKILQQLKI